MQGVLEFAEEWIWPWLVPLILVTTLIWIGVRGRAS